MACENTLICARLEVKLCDLSILVAQNSEVSAKCDSNTRDLCLDLRLDRNTRNTVVLIAPQVSRLFALSSACKHILPVSFPELRKVKVSDRGILIQPVPHLCKLLFLAKIHRLELI